MTTLFSVFAPVVCMSLLKMSLMILLILTFLMWLNVMSLLMEKALGTLSYYLSNLFSISETSSIMFMMLFVTISALNLFSMMVYSYPVTTTLGFNFSMALFCWISMMLIQSIKSKSVYAFLPSNSPWYLVPFLCLVELTSIMVRPITLCFRLLANMTAGHVLLALICKMSLIWTLGSLFGSLELMVSMVQAFVFSMLVSVYFEEAVTH